ncbi:HAD family phosphatase [Luteitalea sp.]|uniref:HAD family hydrolase n=1 Tax=Luteitalea sp. TaxID=2004800 RepID=UPI0025C05F37|nr:HAD family phosphatase [Luteitalea sp.]
MTDLSAFRPRAVVFDLDGTLVDNMSLHAQAFERFAEAHGLPPLTMDLRRRIDGKRNSEIFPMLFEREMSMDEMLQLEEDKEGAYRQLSRGRLVPVRGALTLLARLEAHGIGVAVATSAPLKNVVHTFAETGLDARLTIIARGDEVPRGKPFPDVFALAAQRLQVPPDECLAFEDAPIGVAAAVGAGMVCVGVATTFSVEQFNAHIPAPHAVLTDYEAFLEGPGAWLRDA